MSEEEVLSNKLAILGRLSAGIFHEIRNPLSVVKLNVDYLSLLMNELPEEALDSIHSANEALKRIEEIINSIMIFTRKGQKSDDYCSLYEISRKALEIISYSASKENISLINNIPVNAPVIIFEKNKFLQILLNLLTNSIQACCKNGRIELSIETGGNGLIYKVSDDGCGISEENKSKIFQDFFTDKKDGTGIGLSLCRAILQEYTCQIDFENNIGKGSTFFIDIDKNLIREYGKKITDN